MFQVSTTRPFPDLMAEAMQRMVEQMAKAPAESSGKLDADFVGQMIPHHQGAIDMTRAVALYARKGDRAIRNLITTILTTQPDEIRRMEAINPSRLLTPPQYTKNADRIEEKMISYMNVDFATPVQLFVEMMIPHHKAGIAMAKNYLMFGKNPRLKNLAQGIIVEQEHEIRLMHLWKQNHI